MSCSYSRCARATLSEAEDAKVPSERATNDVAPSADVGIIVRIIVVAVLLGSPAVGPAGVVERLVSPLEAAEKAPEMRISLCAAESRSCGQLDAAETYS